MAEPTVGDDREGAPGRIERHAHVLWIASERGESGRLRADSRAFSSLPVSLARDIASSCEATTPGELLAAAQSASFAVTLADLLAHDGSPAHELAVDATCELREEPSGARQITVLRLRVSCRERGLDRNSFRERAEAVLASCPVSHALSAAIPITLDAELLEAP